MSKKLMMNNYSENGLMPVIDGLICWLDGRDGSGTDTIWKDRSGNENDAILNGFTFDGTNGWVGSSLLFNGRNCCTLNNLNTIEGNNKTFEFEVLKNTNANVGFLSNRTTAFNGFSIWVSGAYFNMDLNYLSGEQQRKSLGILEGKISISINENGELKLFQNGEFINSFIYNAHDLNFPYNTSIWKLGAFGNTMTGISGNIPFIRVYNRALTEEEIRQNYLYEKSINRGE